MRFASTLAVLPNFMVLGPAAHCLAGAEGDTSNAEDILPSTLIWDGRYSIILAAVIAGCLPSWHSPHAIRWQYPFLSLKGTPSANHHLGDARAQNPALFVLEGFKTMSARSS